MELQPGAEFSGLMEQFDESQRISERRRRHLAEWEEVMKQDDSTDRFLCHVQRQTEMDEAEFQVEFDSDDEEGRLEEVERQKRLLKAHYTVDKEIPQGMYSFSRPIFL